jgi:membrane protease subunit HflK
VTDVNVAKLQPPPDVQEAFNDVIKAREDEQALQNKAKRYRETHIPIAKGQAERIMFEADTFYKQQITKAQAETQAFEMVLKEHQAAPDILKARLYYEMIDDIYSKNPKILLDADVQSPIIYTSPAPVEPVKTAVQSPVYTKALTKDKK